MVLLQTAAAGCVSAPIDTRGSRFVWLCSLPAKGCTHPHPCLSIEVLRGSYFRSLNTNHSSTKLFGREFPTNRDVAVALQVVLSDFTVWFFSNLCSARLNRSCARQVCPHIARFPRSSLTSLCRANGILTAGSGKGCPTDWDRGLQGPAAAPSQRAQPQPLEPQEGSTSTHNVNIVTN